MLHALLIFLLTYVLISLRRLAHIPLERPAVALLGASLMIITGVLAPGEALTAIDLHTILLLIGMMMVVVTLESTGFFNHLALFVVARARSPAQLLVFLGLTTAVLSALVLNDTVVLFFTPVIIHACRRLGLRPVKYLVVEAVTANIGSLATEIGNPQNAYIGVQSGISFLRYLLIMGPVAAVALALALLLFLVFYRRELREPMAPRPVSELEPQNAITQPGLLRLALFVTALIFAAFLLSHRLGLPLSLIALSGGSLLVFFAPVAGRSSPRVLFRRIDWSVILLFIGLFIVLKAVAVSGLLDALFDAMERISAGSVRTVWGLGALAAVLSNLISNVPATILLAPLAQEVGTEAVWFALATSTTLAGNATILGAAANIIVAERSEELGVGIAFWEFARVGLPITLATLLASFAMIALLT